MRWLKPSVTPSQSITFWMYLSHLLSQGISLVSALCLVREITEEGRFKEVVDSLVHQLAHGQLFSEALEAFPRIFSPGVVFLVMAAEKTGNYGFFFQLIGDQEKWLEELRTFIKQSLRYPLFVFMTLLIFLGVFCVWVAPAMKDFLAILGAETPEAEIGGGEFSVLLLFFLGLLLVLTFIKLKTGRNKGKPLRYYLPYLGPILFELQALRFFYVFGVLLSAKIDVLGSLYYGAQSLTCPWLRAKLLAEEANLVKGFTLSQVLTPLFGQRNFFCKIIPLGEQTGKMGDLFINSSALVFKDLQGKIKGVMDILPSLMILVMSGFLITLILQVIFPIYHKMGSVGV